MIVHAVLAGVAEGPLGVGLDVVLAAGRLVAAGMAARPKRRDTLQQQVLSIGGAAVRSATGRPIAVDGALEARRFRRGDVIVIPGLAEAATERTIAQLLARDDVAHMQAVLARAAGRGALIAASCSATFVLAGAGLLAGRGATTTWWLVPVFARRFPEVSVRADCMVVDDGVLTAGSAFAHADLMLAVIARIGTPSLAHLVARYLVLDERTSQTRYMVMEHLRTSDPALRAVERFATANVARQIRLSELAKAAALSPRTLARRVHAALGVTPLELVQRVRVARAAHLLETTRDSVDAVAARVGYADAAAFRRVFRRHAGESPRRRAARAR